MTSLSMRSLYLLAIAGLCTACPDDKPSNEGPTEQEVGSPSGEGILNIEVLFQKSSTELLVKIAGHSAGDVLSCSLDQEVIASCSEHFELERPKRDGVYTLSAIAKRDGLVVAVGEARFEIGGDVFKGEIQVSDRAKGEDLRLEIDPSHKVQGDENFQNGMALRLDRIHQLKFKFAKTPQCAGGAKPEVRCVFDRADAPFRPLCSDELGQEFGPGTLARGMQRLSVEASCDGRQGPTLLLYWYGVEKDYKALAVSVQLKEERPGEGKGYVQLQRTADCPLNLLSFECSTDRGKTYARCSSVQKNPQASWLVRSVCQGVPGPARVFASL